MKKSNSFYLVALFLIFAANLQVHAQAPVQPPAEEYKTFGAGISFQPFGIANILEEFEGVPLTKFNFAINATKGFRTEIELGYYSRNNKSDDSKANALDVGIGLLGTKRINANVIMGGIKFNYAGGKFNYENGSGQNIEDKFKRFAVGPVLGYEHILGGQFGIGGELGLKYSSYKETPGDADSEDVESTSLYTDSAIFVRFYF